MEQTIHPTTSSLHPMNGFYRTYVHDETLPYGYAEGYVSPDGLFVTRREGAVLLWDVWASPEAFTTNRMSPAALVEGNLTLESALEAAFYNGGEA